MKTNQMGGGPNASDPSLAADSLKNKQAAAAKKGSIIKKTNSWEEEDVKRGRKYAAEGKMGHAKALFDDAHGSWNWSKSHHSTGAEHHHVVNRIAGKNSRG